MRSTMRVLRSSVLLESFCCSESPDGATADSGCSATKPSSRIRMESRSPRHAPASSFAQAIFAYATFSASDSGKACTLRSRLIAANAESLYGVDVASSCM